MSDKKEIVSASPKVRKLAREFGTDIYQIEGSQRKGRVSEEDVKSYIKASISEKSIKNTNSEKNNIFFHSCPIISLVQGLF